MKYSGYEARQLVNELRARRLETDLQVKSILHQGLADTRTGRPVNGKEDQKRYQPPKKQLRCHLFLINQGNGYHFRLIRLKK